MKEDEMNVDAAPYKATFPCNTAQPAQNEQYQAPKSGRALIVLKSMSYCFNFLALL